MSEIIVPNEQKPKESELKYKSTEVDEEQFFLMYHMNFQPSEVKALDEDYRKWLIARFVAQKQTERELIQQARMIQDLKL